MLWLWEDETSSFSSVFPFAVHLRVYSLDPSSSNRVLGHKPHAITAICKEWSGARRGILRLPLRHGESESTAQRDPGVS